MNFSSPLDPTPATNYSLWRVMKSRNKPPTYTPPLQKPNNKWVFSDQDKADTFAAHLESTFQPNYIISYVIPTITGNEADPIRSISPREILKIVSKLRDKKAPGMDLITTQMLKEAPKKFRVYLTYVFNAILHLRYIHNHWKLANVIMIPKPGKPLNKPKSFHPISLLPLLSKVFEKLYLTRLKDVTSIPNNQFRFHTQHSTTEQVHRVATTIRQSLEEKQYCPALFLDISQAFDRV